MRIRGKRQFDPWSICFKANSNKEYNLKNWQNWHQRSDSWAEIFTSWHFLGTGRPKIWIVLHFVLVNFCNWRTFAFAHQLLFLLRDWRQGVNFPLFVSLFRTICSECGFERSKKFSIWNWKFDQTVAKEETQRKFSANLNNQRSFRWRASTQFTALPEEIKEWQNTQLFLNKLKRFTLAIFLRKHVFIFVFFSYAQSCDKAKL